MAPCPLRSPEHNIAVAHSVAPARPLSFSVPNALWICASDSASFGAKQQLAQFLLGKAASRVEAARDTLFHAADVAYADAESSGKSLSVESKVRVQLAVSFAAEACAEAMRFINDVVGTSSIRIGQPFERHFRDLNVLLQHSDKSSQRYASAGRLMLGVENDWFWLSF